MRHRDSFHRSIFSLGPVPEMLRTAYGSLDVGLDAQPGQSIVIHGGTSSVGMATAVLARRRGMTVLATTRDLTKCSALTGAGADHVILDDGHVAAEVRQLYPDGADPALEPAYRLRRRGGRPSAATAAELPGWRRRRDRRRADRHCLLL